MAKLSAVYRDPRGKPTHGGVEHEHCFTVKAGTTVLVRRFETEDEARTARDEMTRDERGS